MGRSNEGWDTPHLADPPMAMHALLNDAVDMPLITGRMYPTMCDTQAEHQGLTKEEIRGRFVCALCHQAQVEALRTALNNVIAEFDAHMRVEHTRGGL